MKTPKIHPLLNRHKMQPFGGDSILQRRYQEGFNHALILASETFREPLEQAEHALRRAFLETDALAEGRNANFRCAPVIRDYCKEALASLDALSRA